MANNDDQRAERFVWLEDDLRVEDDPDEKKWTAGLSDAR